MTYVPVLIKAILPKVSKVDNIFGLWPKIKSKLCLAQNLRCHDNVSSNNVSPNEKSRMFHPSDNATQPLDDAAL
jgi:hypothetical protein